MEELGQLAVNGGVAVVLAYVVLRWQRSDLVARAEQCKRCMERVLALAEAERADKVMILDVVRGNTAALTQVVDAVRTLGANGKLGKAEVRQGG